MLLIQLLYHRFPLWPYMKLVVCLWLVLPTFNGAAYVYENYVRKYIKIGAHVSSTYSEEQRRVLQMMTLDARKSVERYIEKHGPDAFERIIKAVRELSDNNLYICYSRYVSLCVTLCKKILT